MHSTEDKSTSSYETQIDLSLNKGDVDIRAGLSVALTRNLLETLYLTWRTHYEHHSFEEETNTHTAFRGGRTTVRKLSMKIITNAGKRLPSLCFNTF